MDLKSAIARKTDRKIAAAVIFAAALIAVSFAAPVFAAPPDSGEPETSVVPAGSGAAPQAAPSVPPDETPAAAPTQKKAAAPHFKFNPSGVEPGSARAKLTEDAWAYTEPAKSSAHVERVYKDKYVVITGSTHYFVRVKLKSGKTAYVEQTAVDLVKPTDKVFRLTANAAVLDQPNRWGKKLSEVHAGRDVHVVGIALSYVQIRMRSGLEGFIPTSAMQ
ncbi:MAG: hypothetical protein ACYDC3_19010 [Candidatus Binataceae bacterium]